jgi:bacterioferritin-associated ferredoxin
MCFCSGTKRCEIERLFGQGYDLQAISRKTGALSGCGGCEWDIEQFLRELAEQQGQH